MKILIPLFLSFIIAISSFAREVKPFNDGWEFKKGPFSSDPILFSDNFDERWEKVSLPHTWNNIDMQTDKNSYYAGETYYKKSYTPDISLKDKRLFLRFEGVGSVAEIYINGKYAGNHKGGYSAFAIEMTNLLKYGEANEILIKVDNTPRPDVVPINNTLFGVYGGIYRPVELMVTEKVNIAVTDYASPGIYITQKNVSRKSADIDILIKMENKNRHSQTVNLVSTIYEMSGKEKVKQISQVEILPQGRQFFTHSFSINQPHLWQGLEDPYLYKIETQVIIDNKVIDEVTQPLGIRHFELKAGDGMYLNSKKVPMYGVCRHQDWWQLGSALTNVQHDADLEIIKEIGATTIRLAHYQQSEYIYSKCDSIGLMVWAEIPFVNRVSTKEADNAKQQLIELIRQNYNHPSIYTWGLHNEVYRPIDYTASLTAELHDLAKSEDPYRYTVSVNGYGDPGHGVNMNADIQGINRYFGWYEKKIQDIEPWIEGMEKDYKGYKIMLAEYGAEANIYQQQETAGDVGDCCGFNKNYNETFATRFHEIQWGHIAKHPYLIASYLWNTFDFAIPASSQGGVEARNMKGLVTFDRKVKKDPFYWYKTNWSKEPVIYITQRRVVNRQNQITPVTVYSNIGTPQLIVNGKEYKDFQKGTTDVHYIFQNIELKEGENIVEVKANKDNQTFSDKIYWNYSSANKISQDTDQPQENKNEHIGL
ncbi:MAG: glycoside hydrolase family 2 TIM barrel-domain containing protein [Dysgonomonas sp.]|nr:glycoside hydrolase family 2 TIM barrel-domain containing protein [Dysgonomonas sp.]